MRELEGLVTRLHALGRLIMSPTGSLGTRHISKIETARRAAPRVAAVLATKMMI